MASAYLIAANIARLLLNSKALHGRITQLWARACESLKKCHSVDEDFAQIDRLTAELDAHVNMFEAAVGHY